MCAFEHAQTLVQWDRQTHQPLCPCHRIRPPNQAFGASPGLLLLSPSTISASKGKGGGGCQRGHTAIVFQGRVLGYKDNCSFLKLKGNDLGEST